MQIFCIEEFKVEFEKLISKKQYSSFKNELIEYFFDKDISALANGTNLNNDFNTPFIKKRLNGSGGYRIYYLLVIINNNLYLGFVHPKTGPLGASNITDHAKAALLKKLFNAIKSNNLYELTVNKNIPKTVSFKHQLTNLITTF